MDNSSTRVPGVSSSWLWPGPAPAVMGIWGNELADGRSADGGGGGRERMCECECVFVVQLKKSKQISKKF